MIKHDKKESRCATTKVHNMSFVQWYPYRNLKAWALNAKHSCSILVLNETLRSPKVCLHHLADERVKVDTTLPSEETFGFGRITKQEALEASLVNHWQIKEVKKDILDFCRTEVFRVYFHDCFTSLHIDALLVQSTAFPPDCKNIDKIKARVRNSRTYFSVIPTASKDLFTNSRTGWVSPVARTKSSALGCWSIIHIPST